MLICKDIKQMIVRKPKQLNTEAWNKQSNSECSYNLHLPCYGPFKMINFPLGRTPGWHGGVSG